ncbi:DNA polymerase I [Haloferula chungangensis]|uniref:DNA polymerase I n=1 Tax=Haloferula chungangensis TaxID=1048331 RepID=A0ABW2L0R8_9BACT
MPRLFLLDGMALVYRAHFAFITNPIRNSKGVNTSALYGFTNTLLTILENEKPSHIGVAFDTSAPTSRHEKFPEYKAQREDMPEELAAAIPHVKRLCQAFQIPVLEKDGFEADDLIGTLAKKAEIDGFETYMVTPDKDFAQLISASTFMWKPGRKGNDHEVVGLPELSSIWGVEQPAQIIDLLGMMGDSVDNIPGIPGVGPKTAQKLISEYGSLEGVLANTDKLKGKQKEKVIENADLARLSKDLATIIVDAPIDVSWDDLVLSSRDDNRVKDLFTEFEFRTLSKRLFGTDTQSESPSSAEEKSPDIQPTLQETFKTIGDVEHHYQLADTPEKQAELFKHLAAQKCFCFDTETTGLDRFEARLLGIAFSWKAGEAWYLPYSNSIKTPLEEILSGRAEKMGHNLKYDLSVLQQHGIATSGPYFDTMLAHALLHPEQRHGMDYLAESLLGYSPIKLATIASQTEPEGDPDDLFAHAAKKKASKELDMASIPLESLAEYAAEDADITWQLSEHLRPQLRTAGQDAIFSDLEAPLLPVLVRMEMEGIALDTGSLSDISSSLESRIGELSRSISEQAGRPFNLNSPKQLGEILFNDLKLVEKPKKTRKGQFKTDEQTLSSLAGKHPIIDSILEYREATKLKSTYVDALPAHIAPSTGRIHTHFHQLVAATGRLASTDPNIQNIPIRSAAGREIRKAFVPREGFTLLSCDYSQIELRVMASLANDESMIDDFRNQRDIHTATAARVWSVRESEVTREQRSGAKMVNFGIIYGISAFGLSQRLGIGRAEAAELIDNYFKEYPAIKEFMDRTIAEARESGYVQTLSGRRRYFPDLTSGNQTIRGNAERAAINTPIQGTAADMIKFAMIKVDALLRKKQYQTRMLLQVHDELVFDLHPAEEATLIPEIIGLMETALPLPNKVPILVEHGTGDNWLAAH